MASIRQDGIRWTVQWYFGRTNRFVSHFTAQDEAQVFATFIEAEVKKAKESGKPTPYISGLMSHKKENKLKKLGLPTETNLSIDLVDRLAKNLQTKPIAKEAFLDKFVSYKKSDVSPVTEAAYRGAWMSLVNLVPFKNLPELTPTSMQMLKQKLLDENKAPETVNNKLRHLRVLFVYAVQRGYMLRNPLDDKDKVKRLKSDKEPKPYLTKQETRRLLDIAEEHGKDIHLFCSLGVYEGMRRKEINALRWGHFSKLDLLYSTAKSSKRKLLNSVSGKRIQIPSNESIVTPEEVDRVKDLLAKLKATGVTDIPHTKGTLSVLDLESLIERGEEESLVVSTYGSVLVKKVIALGAENDGQQERVIRVKNKTARPIPLHKKLVSTLLKYIPVDIPLDDLRRRYVINPEKLSWDRNGNRYSYRKPLAAVLKKAKLVTVNRFGEDAPVTPHIFRYTFCSQLLSDGVSLYLVQQWAGHSQGEMTSHYGHVITESMELDY